MGKETEKLREIIKDIDDLVDHHVSSSSAAFKAWHVRTERLLIKLYGDKSLEVKNFRDTSFSLMVFGWDTSEREFADACCKNLKSTKLIFQDYLKELEENEIEPTINISQSREFKKVFIVHGHNVELRESVARLVERQGIEAIILNEQANKGKTIIEKIEDNSEVAGAICLFTPDDEGKAIRDKDLKKRARQNVLFEAGYFIGILGRENVIMLAAKDVEIPSDLSGVLYTDIDNWKFSLLKEMKAMGYEIDYNKLD